MRRAFATVTWLVMLCVPSHWRMGLIAMAGGLYRAMFRTAQSEEA